MTNRFDSVNYPESLPDRLIAGDRWVWKRSDLSTDYPSSAYSIKWVLRRQGSQNEIEIDATASGNDWLAEVSSADTARHAPGTWEWRIQITRTSDSERITLETGFVEIRENADQSTSGDPRSHTERVLAALQALIEGRATTDQSSYSIATPGGSRTLSRLTPAELTAWEGIYRHRVAVERDRERVRAGRRSRRKVKMRF